MTSERSVLLKSVIAPLCIFILSATQVLAQESLSGKSVVPAPRRPSFSPYLNLGIENSGAISPFHAFVIPGIEQQKQQMNQFMLQSRTMVLERNKSAGKEIRQTGLGGKFQNYSHFYQDPPSIPKR